MSIDDPLSSPPQLRITLLWMLVGLTCLAITQRALLMWKPAPEITPGSAYQAGLKITLLELRPALVTPDDYQLTALVQRHAPGWLMKQHRVISTSTGAVAIGVLSTGQSSLQTCWMATGRAAVSFEQMRDQLLLTGPRGEIEKRSAALAAALLGQPFRQRGCLLVLMRSTGSVAPPPRGQRLQENRLLQGWTTLQPALQALRSR